MPKTHRKTGAQPGNHNALKHGFYSKFRTVGRVDHVPARAVVQELDHDIALTRATLRDLFAHDPHNAKLIAYTISLQNRLLRNRQTLIDSERRAKRRQRRSHANPPSVMPRKKAEDRVRNDPIASPPTSSLPKPQAPHVADPVRVKRCREAE